MSEVISKVSERQIKFFEEEFGLDIDSLTALSDDELYDKIYDPCCVIEEIEMTATLDNESELSERGKIASEIVTLLGNTIE